MNMKRRWLVGFVAFYFFLLISSAARAQPLFWQAKSIEATVANADLVFIAKIVELGGEDEIDAAQAREVTVAVERALKLPLGESYDRLSLHMRHPRAGLVDWRNQAHRLLLAVGGDGLGTAEAIDLDDRNLEVFSADLTLLRDPEAVIRLAEETARRIPGAIRRLHTFPLTVPSDVASKTQWAKYSGVFAIVPVDDRLEKRAHEYLQSDNYSRRNEGALALQYFKSDENIALLKALLDDPGWGYLRHAEYNEGIEVRHFGVRYDAFRILKSWDVQVEKPVVREEVEKLGSVTLECFSNKSAVDEGEIKALSKFEKLEDLILRNSPLTDDQLKAVAGLTNLQSLSLDGTRVTDAGLKELSALTRLRYLGLAGTRVTDAGLKELARFKSLRKLCLTNTQTTDEGIDELRRLRPDLEIEQ